MDHPIIQIETPSDSHFQSTVLSPITNSHEEKLQSVLQDAALELVGTAVFVYISLAAVHQAAWAAVSTNTPVDQIHIAIGFTIGLTCGIIVALKSGAHLNTSVSFTMWICNKISFKKLLAYTCAQLIGGFLGAVLVVGLYYDRINSLPHYEALLGTFGTIKDPNNSLTSSIFDQLIGSALLMIAIMRAPDCPHKPLIIGLSLGALGLFQGSNGFAFNLARDFAPRVASTIIFGQDPFTVADHWFWVPMIMPFIGMPLGHVIQYYWE